MLAEAELSLRLAELPASAAKLVLDALDRAHDLVGILAELGAEGGRSDLNILAANNAVQRILGHSLRDLVGRPADFLWTDDGPEDRLRRVTEALANEQALPEEVPCRALDGRRVWLSMHFLPVRDPNGSSHVVLLGRDVTEERRRRSADNASQELLAKVFLRAHAAVIIVHDGGRIAQRIRDSLSSSVVHRPH